MLENRCQLIAFTMANNIKKIVIVQEKQCIYIKSIRGAEIESLGCNLKIVGLLPGAHIAL
jgi:hypothetical protein